jgi:diacylglycerol kinase family enzyme
MILAGDSGVSRCINTIIEYIAYQDFMNTIDLEEIKYKLKTPICIIPVGSTNMIASSLYGTTTFNVPLMHLFYGNVIRIDMAAAFSPLNKNKLHSFAFGYSCGFGTTLARYMQRYSKLGLKKFQTSIAKGVSKKQHRLVEAEILFKRDETSDPCDGQICLRG